MDDGQKRIFLGLKWKMFLVLTLVFLVVNGSSAFLVYRKTAGLLETQLANRRIKQVRDLNLVLSDSFARLGDLAAFLSQLMIPMRETSTYSPRHWMSPKLTVQGEALVTGWGMDGVYYFAADDIRTAAVTWPARRAAPEIEALLEQGRRSQRTQARLVCDDDCAQIVVSPVLYRKRLAGLLVVERAIARSQKRFRNCPVPISSYSIQRTQAAMPASDCARHPGWWVLRRPVQTRWPEFCEHRRCLPLSVGCQSHRNGFATLPNGMTYTGRQSLAGNLVSTL